MGMATANTQALHETWFRGKRIMQPPRSGTARGRARHPGLELPGAPNGDPAKEKRKTLGQQTWRADPADAVSRARPGRGGRVQLPGPVKAGL